MKLTKNFKLEEFHCNDGTKVPDRYMDNVKELAENLQVLRDFFDRPIKINSAYRTVHYNKAVCGSSKSQHLQAKASDIVIEGVKPSKVADAIESLIELGEMKQGGVGRYKTFTHYDIRGTKARW